MPQRKATLLPVRKSFRCLLVALFLSAMAACDQQTGMEGPTRPETGTPSGAEMPRGRHTGPKLRIEQKVVDLGTLREGETVDARFVLRNEGDAVLKIHRAKPTCASCTGVSLERREIPPGESGVLTVRIEAKGISGEFVRSIAIESNDPEDSLSLVLVEAEVVPEFTLVPDEVSLGEVVSGQGRTAELSLARNFGGDLELQGLARVPAWLNVILPEQRTARPQERLTLHVGLRDGLSPGPYQGELVLAVNGEVRHELPVRVTARVVSPVRLAQDDVFFGTVPAAERRSKRVRLILAEGVDPGELEIESDAEYLTAQLVPGNGERPPYVRLFLLPTLATGPFSSKVRLRAPFQSGQAVFEAQCFGVRSN